MMKLKVIIFLCLAMTLAATILPPLNAQSLATVAPSGVPAAGYMFEVKSPTGVLINDFDVNFSQPLTSGTVIVGVWALNSPGTYVGEQFSNVNWTLLGFGGGPGAGLFTNPYSLGLGLSFPVFAGQTQSFYVAALTGNGLSTLSHLEGAPGIGTGALVASDSNLEIYEGHFGYNNFSVGVSGSTWAGTIHYTPMAPVADDLQLSRITAPIIDTITCGTYSPTESVTIEIRNIGSNPIPAGSALTAALQVNSNTPIVEAITLPATMTRGDTFLYTFTTTVDLSNPGNYGVTTSISYGPDLNSTNDSISTTFSSGGQRVNSFPFVEDFEIVPVPFFPGIPGGFINEIGESSGPFSDWIWGSNPATLWGPNSPHSGLNYLYVDSQGNHPVVNLRTPCLDLSAISNSVPTFKYFVHSDSLGGPLGANTLSIDVIAYPSGAMTTSIISTVGHLGASWKEQTVDLSAFMGQVIQVVFRVDASQTSGHDIAIDDVSLLEVALTPGQAPQPGKAVFQVNDARNPNGDPVSLGLGGPYSTTLSIGDTLGFEFYGEPLRPVILFGGLLNPAIATFNTIGSVDVGHLPLDPLTGIPAGITVFADGSLGGGLNPYFTTAANGRLDIGFTVPSSPTGILGTFQFVIPTAQSSGIALSNAIQITIQ